MIQVIVFDLDDTLLDTSGLLVPKALENIHREWVRLGQNLSYANFLDLRNVYLKSHSNTVVFEKILSEHPTRDNFTALEIAENLFYEPEIPESLPLIDGADQILQKLNSKYHLALLTSGEEPTQSKKIKSTKLDYFFKDIFITHQPSNYKKKPFFEKLISENKIQPSQLLSVGNRKTSEIREAKKLGCITCWFAFGEHISEIEQSPEDYPDFTIHKLNQLIEVCKL